MKMLRGICATIALCFAGCGQHDEVATDSSQTQTAREAIGERPIPEGTAHNATVDSASANSATARSTVGRETANTKLGSENFDKRGEQYAILIGVRNYRKDSGLRPLKYTENDVTKLSQVLRASGYRPENVILLTDGQGKDNPQLLPERGKIVRQFQSLVRDRGAADSIPVAFSGHGVQFSGDEDSYFCPLDANVMDRKSLISMGEIYQQLKACRAGFKLVLCDACRDDPVASTTRGLSMLKPDPPLLLPPPGGVAVFYSCSPGEFAYEDPDLKHGVFFNYVIEGLAGKADLDKDDQVTLPELEYHAKRRVSDFVRSEIGGRRQMPNLKGDTRGLVAIVEVADASALPEDEPTVETQTAETDPIIANAPRTPLPDGPMGLVAVLSEGSAAVGMLDVSRDGKHVLSVAFNGDLDRRIRMWDVENKKLIRTMTESRIWHGMCFSPDGKKFLALSTEERPTIDIWDTATGSLIETLQTGMQFPYYFRTAAFRSDGNAIIGIAQGRAYSVATLDLKTKVVDGVRMPNSSVFSDMSYDDRRVVTGGRDHLVVWNMESRSMEKQFPFPDAWRVGISGNGRVAAATDRNGDSEFFVRIWDIDEGELLGEYQFNRQKTIEIPVVLTPDGKLAVFPHEEDVVVVDTTTGGSTSFIGHKDAVHDVAVSADGRFAFSGGFDRTIRIWRLPKPGTIKASPNRVKPRSASVPAPSISTAPSVTTTTPKPKPATPATPQKRLLRAQSIGSPVYLAGHSEPVWNTVYSPNGKLIASSGYDPLIIVWDFEQKAQRFTFRPQGASVRCIAMSPDGNLLAAGMTKGVTKIWELRSGELVHTFQVKTEQTGSHLAFSPSGKYLATLSGFGRIEIYDVAAKTDAGDFNVGRFNNHRIAFLPDEQRVLIGGTHSPTLELWEWKTGQRLREYSPQGNKGATMRAMAVTRDGAEVAYCVSGTQIQRWKVETGEPLKTLEFTSPTDMMYSPDGKYLLACGTIGRLFHRETGEPVMSAVQYTRGIRGLWFSEDGKRIRFSGQSAKSQKVLGITEFLLPSNLPQ